MKRALILGLVIGLCFAGVASAGYSPQWQNPVEIPVYQSEEVSLIVFTVYDNSDDRVTIEVTGDIKNYSEIDKKEFVLSERDGQQARESVDIQLFSPSEPGEQITGSIVIKHRAVDQDSAKTEVKYEESVFIAMQATESNSIVDRLGLRGAGLPITVILLTVSTIFGGGYALMKYREDDEDQELIEWEQ